MKKLIKLFPVFALMLGASIAFANGSDSNAALALTKQAKINGVWQPIPAGTEYQCQLSNDECTRMVNEFGVVSSQVKGSYSVID